VVRKWTTREGFADAGLRLYASKWRYYLVGWLLPVVVVGYIVLAAPLLGIGKADFSLVRGVKALMPPGVTAHATLNPWFLLTLPIIAIFVAPLSFGEEFGWRSYLQLRLFPNQPALSAVVTGVIWAAWHLPVLVRGYAFPNNPYAGLPVFAVSCILLSIIFGWLRRKTESIWSASLAHAATNAVAGNMTFLLFSGGANLLLVSNLGMLAWIPLGVLSAWILFTGQLKATTVPELSNVVRA
jgi:membrane protease YdiL (CAAX protease family)